MIDEFKELDVETKIAIAIAAGVATVATVGLLVIYKQHANKITKAYIESLAVANQAAVDHSNNITNTLVNHLSTLTK